MHSSVAKYNWMTVLSTMGVSSLTVFNNYTVIDGVTVNAGYLWPTHEEHFKNALRAYNLLFESCTELNECL